MNKYRESYHALSYTAEQKAEIARQAAAAAQTSMKKTHKKINAVAKIASIAACLVSVLTISAEAAGIPTPVSEILAPIFGGTVAQTDVIDKIGRPIDASDTDNGITISADAIIGDEYNATIVFTIRRDDGTPLLPEEVSEKSLIVGGDNDISMIKNGGAHGSARFKDTTPGDSEIQYVYHISSDVPLNKGTCKVSFKDIMYMNPDTESTEPILKGNWKFRFEIDYEDSSLVLGNGETFQQSGMNFTIAEVRLSPAAFRVSYEVDSEVQWSDAPNGRLPEEDRRQMERYLENIQVLLTKKDGSVINLSYSGGSIRPENGRTYCTKSEVLEEIIPLEEVESIQVGSIIYHVCS